MKTLAIIFLILFLILPQVPIACTIERDLYELPVEITNLQELEFELFLEFHVKHYDQVPDSTQKVSSKLPAELLKSLKLFYSSPIGERIIKFAIKNSQVIEFVRADTEPLDFETFDNQIIYTQRVRDWFYQNIKEIAPKGSNLGEVGLDVLIAHEMGHTIIGQDALELEPIDSFVASKVGKGVTTMLFSKKKMKEKEFRAVHHFENPYREFRKTPVRNSYYEENDVKFYYAGQ